MHRRRILFRALPALVLVAALAAAAYAGLAQGSDNQGESRGGDDSPAPLLSPSGKVLANFTRVETFGSKNTHWATATVDPKDPNVFEFQPRLVPANG